MPQTKVKRIIAGPGAGKTTNLINEVISVLDKLKHNHFIAVITYTNAATEKIESGISKKINIPPNLFIGTIHSFLNKFVLIPYADKLEILPADISFIDDIRPSNPKYKNRVLKNAREVGLVTYDQTEWISSKIILGGSISFKHSKINITKKLSSNFSEAVSKRLQFIFVDEYQDATTTQHKIFEALIKTGYVEYFYCVGDPEQYIYGFTYNQKSISKPQYNEIPINTIQSMSNCFTEKIVTNYRSTNTIVDFINKFSLIEQQVYLKKTLDHNNPPVYFIDIAEENGILSKFNELCSRHNLKDKSKFYLSYANTTINSATMLDMDTFSNSRDISQRLVSDCLNVICSISFKSQKTIVEELGLNKLSLRKIVISILKKLNRLDYISEEDFGKLLGTYQISKRILKNTRKNNQPIIDKLLSNSKNLSKNNIDVKSTIHKSKGLESCSVLVVAKKSTELIKWLETDRAKRAEDNEDVCRLGYVAFSRAKELLCLACLEDANHLHENLKELGLTLEK